MSRVTAAGNALFGRRPCRWAGRWRGSSCSQATGVAAEDQDGAVRVVDKVVADRAEQRPSEAAEAALADGDQLRAVRGLDQGHGWMASEDAGLHQVPVVCLYLFADDRVHGPLRVVRNNLLVIHFGGRLAEAANHVGLRNLPGHDGVHGAAVDRGMVDGPAQGRPRRRRTIDPDHDPGAVTHTACWHHNQFLPPISPNLPVAAFRSPPFATRYPRARDFAYPPG